jgi:hypothetical protein
MGNGTVTPATPENKVQQYIDFKMPSILGMGAVGPTLAVITATLYSALSTAMKEPPHWAYPIIMLVLSGLLAVFPVSKTDFPMWQRVCLWPVVAAIIFSMSWGTNNGLSAGEEGMKTVTPPVIPPISALSLIPSAYAGDDAVVVPVLDGSVTNRVNFSKVDFKSKAKVSQEPFKKLPVDTWGVSWTNSPNVYLKDDKGVWWGYTIISAPAASEPVSKQAYQGGFFRKF